MYVRVVVPILLTLVLSTRDSRAQQAPANQPVHPAPTPTAGGNPRVSPDGKHIIFAMRLEVNKPQMRIMNADGSGQRNFGPDSLGSLAPNVSWSADGQRVMSSNRTSLLSLDITGGGARNIGAQKAGSQALQWCRDGRIVYAMTSAFVPGTLPKGSIHIMNADGSGDATLLSDSALNYNPTPSPDCTRIVFSRVTERGKGGKLFVMGVDGSGLRQLSAGTTGDEAPAWSPDGHYVAFQANKGRGQGTDIAVLDVRSGAQHLLTNNGPGQNDETPSWFPDGKRLAIQSDRDGAWNIYLMDLDGKTLAQLTRRP